MRRRLDTVGPRHVLAATTATVWREPKQVSSPEGAQMERWTGKAEPLWKLPAQRAAEGPTSRAHSSFLPIGSGSRRSTELSLLV